MLPEWEVRPSRKLVPDWLWLICPNCGGRAIVPPDWGVEGYASRPCTHCFKAARIPEAYRTWP